MLAILDGFQWAPVRIDTNTDSAIMLSQPVGFRFVPLNSATRLICPAGRGAEPAGFDGSLFGG